MRYTKHNKLVLLILLNISSAIFAAVKPSITEHNNITESSISHTPNKNNKANQKIGINSENNQKVKNKSKKRESLIQESIIESFEPTTHNIISNDNSNSDSGQLDQNTVVLNFENSDIQSTIKAISQLSGKNFVIDPRVKGTVTIVSDKPIAKTDSYKVLETALRMQGFAVVEADGVIKVLPEVEAKTYGMQTVSESGRINKNQIGDQIVTKIFIIQHGSAGQLANSLRPLIAQNNSISVYPNSNALIVTDYASNITRIGKIINQLSSISEVKSQPTVVQLKYSIAADVAQILQSYLQTGGPGGGGDGPSVTITVDSNDNAIILYSTIQERVEEIKNLALKLDRNSSGSNNNLHVVYLKNADAAHIAEVLRVVAYGQENADLTATSASAKFANEPGSMFQSASGGGGASFGGGGGSSKTSAQSGGGNRNSGGQGGKDQPKMIIQAEPTINALIIQAPEAIYHNLRMIIDMLDVRRAQIMIEAMIVDINTNKEGAFGVQWALAGGNNQVAGVAVGNYAGNGSALTNIAGAGMAIAQGAKGGGTGTPPSIPNEMYVGLVTGTVTVGGQTIPSLGVLADMISSNSSGNILSRPTLITLDNEEAKIMVGSNVPIPNGSYTNTASTNTITNTYTRQDVGTFLDVKPLITQSGAIQMDIYQEDSQVDPASLSNTSGAGPSFLKRNMRATLLVDDGQIIAIGGMTRDQVTLDRNGIPLLSDIPYLGWLFSWQHRRHEKTNLVLFLRPVIIRNVDGYKALSNNRYQYIIEQQNMIRAKGNLMLPGIDPVTLDNQLPYSNEKIPPQVDNTIVQTPIVDMRRDQIKNNSNGTITPNLLPRNTNSPNNYKFNSKNNEAVGNDTVISPAK